MPEALLGVLRALGMWLLDVGWLLLGWLGDRVLAVALWLTGEYDLAVAAWVEPHYAAILLDPRYHSAPQALLWLVGGYVVLIWLRRFRHTAPNGGRVDGERPLGPRHTPLLVRLLDDVLIRLGLRRPRDLHVIDGEHIDRRYYPHSVTSGVTGGGKTNSVAATRIDGARPTVVHAFDFSGPLLGAVQALERARPGSTVIWTPEGELGLDVMCGTPRQIVRRWSAAFEDNGVGQFKRAFRKWGQYTLEEIIAERGDLHPRNWRDHLDAEWRQKNEYPPLKMTTLERNALDSWLLRIDDVLGDLGPNALGHGLDQAYELKRGRTVFHHIDAAVQDGTLAALVGLLAQEDIRCVRKVRGGFRVIAEEVGNALRELPSLRLLMQAGRVRGVYVDLILQSVGGLPDWLRQNVRVWVMFAQEEEGEKRACAARTGLRPTAFEEGKASDGRLPRYHAWLKVGNVLKRVSFAKAPEAVYEVDWDDEDEEVEERPEPSPGPRGGARQPATDKKVSELLGRRAGSPSGRSRGEGVVATSATVGRGSAGAPPGVKVVSDQLSPWQEFNSEARWLLVWEMLGRPTRRDVCWLVPETMVQSDGYASFSVEGEKVGLPQVYERFGCPNGPREAKAKGAKWQLDHDCHTQDETCPGGEACPHRRCVNPFTARPVSSSEQIARQKLQQRAYAAWLESPRHSRLQVVR